MSCCIPAPSSEDVSLHCTGGDGCLSGTCLVRSRILEQASSVLKDALALAKGKKSGGVCILKVSENSEKQHLGEAGNQGYRVWETEWES